jgi:hypothetical protein
VVLAREHAPLGVRQCGCDGVGGLGQSGEGLVSGVDDGGNGYSGPAAAPVGIGLDVVRGLVVVDEGGRNRYEASATMAPVPSRRLPQRAAR